MCKPFYVVSIIFKLYVHFQVVLHPFYVLAAILWYLSHFQVVCQPFYFYVSYFHVLIVILFSARHFIYFVSGILYVHAILGCFSHVINPFFISYCRKCRLMSMIRMHMVDLLPRKIAKTLMHLTTTTRGLGGEHVKLLSREVLEKLL
jgi:hypothetical protein